MTGVAAQRAALVAALSFYQRHLRGSWVPDYLTSRRLASRTEPARLGYAPDTWSALTETLTREGHEQQTLLEVGLTRMATNGNAIDALRDRLVVPVVDAAGDLCGFTGRCRPGTEDQAPKWLNSAAGDLFHKRRLLYALGEDRSTLARGAMPVLVEGAMDRLALQEASSHIAVVGLATLGTALTAEHVDVLTTHIGRQRPIAVCFDADAAGRQATMAAWELLSAGRGPHDAPLLHLALPDGHDPASLLEAEGAASLRRHLLHPTPLAHVVADYHIDAAGRLDHAGKRVALARHLVQQIPRLHSSTVAPYLAHLGRRLDLDHPTIAREALDAVTNSEHEAVLADFTSRAATTPPSTYRTSSNGTAESQRPSRQSMSSAQAGQER